MYFQYYDWDNNLCLPLENVLNDEVQLDEKDTVIPAELDPSQNSIFPDFEANQLQQLVSMKILNRAQSPYLFIENTLFWTVFNNNIISRGVLHILYASLLGRSVL